VVGGDEDLGYETNLRRLSGPRKIMVQQESPVEKALGTPALQLPNRGLR